MKTSKAMKGTKATDLLKKQHKDVKGLFKKLENADDERGRRQLLEQIAMEFKAHTTIEEGDGGQMETRYLELTGRARRAA